jgi:hypothetical protein
VKALVVLVGLASVALVQIGALMTEQAWYWRFLPSLVLSSAEDRRSPLACR